MAKKRTKSGSLPAKMPPEDATEAKLLADLRELIESARIGIAQAVNSGQVFLYWRVGERILTDVLRSKRATYGEADCRDGVATIDRRLWTRLGGEKSPSDDPIRPALSRPGDCRGAVARIEPEPLR